jgi:hypothetical protein
MIMDRIIQDLNVGLHLNGNDSMSQPDGTNCMPHMANFIHILIIVTAFPVPEGNKTHHECHTNAI